MPGTIQTAEAQRDTIATVTPQNKIETKNKRDSFSLSESDQSDDLIQHAEVKRLFGKLSDDVFGEPLHENQWPNDMEHWLDEALPTSRESWKLIHWFYRLPPGHEIFKVTRRRQSMRTLIENLRSEVQKIRSARQTIGLNGLYDGEPINKATCNDGWTREHLEAFRVEFSDAKPPARFNDRPVDYQRRIDKRVKEDRERKMTAVEI